MMVADIDMTRPNENCPAGFRKVTASGKTMCGGQSSRCTVTTFSPHGIEYSRVCGRITAYQFGTSDAFGPYVNYGGSIDDTFVDGIVLTYGSPRKHIWTFAAGDNQYRTDQYGCPCNGAPYGGRLPPYIGNDYFCESGHRYDSEPPFTYLTNDPLWDGAGCVHGTCCDFNSPPWFCKDLPHPTTDDIELRLCVNEDVSNEDVPFEVVTLCPVRPNSTRHQLYRGMLSSSWMHVHKYTHMYTQCCAQKGWSGGRAHHSPCAISGGYSRPSVTWVLVVFKVTSYDCMLITNLFSARCTVVET
jgi:hypothetical protein